jgi:hypothetical protein
MEDSLNSRINYNENASLPHQQLSYGLASSAEISVSASPAVTLNFFGSCDIFIANTSGVCYFLFYL